MKSHFVEMPLQIPIIRSIIIISCFNYQKIKTFYCSFSGGMNKYFELFVNLSDLYFIGHTDKLYYLDPENWSER